MKYRRNILFLPIIMAFSGCITVDRLDTQELVNKSETIQPGATFFVNKDIFVLGTTTEVRMIRRMGEDGVTTTSGRSKEGSKLAERINQHIVFKLEEKGLREAQLSPEYEVFFKFYGEHEDKYGEKETMLYLRLVMVALKTEEVVYDRASKYVINERPDDRAVEQIVGDLLSRFLIKDEI